MTAFVGAALVLVAGHSLTSSFMAMELDLLHQYAGALSCFSRILIKKYSALRVTAWSALVGAIPLLLLSIHMCLSCHFTLLTE